MNNPLRELFDAVNGDSDFSCPSVTARRDRVRAWACRHYSWAIPNEEAIIEIGRHSPIIEVGAGLGYWARLIADYHREKGQVITHICYDWGKQGEGNNWGKPHFQVNKGEPKDAFSFGIRREFTLFLCWPPRAKDTPMLKECLDLYRGNTILYIGEWNGTNGWDSRLETEWRLEKKIAIPCWATLHDTLHVFSR